MKRNQPQEQTITEQVTENISFKGGEKQENGDQINENSEQNKPNKMNKFNENVETVDNFVNNSQDPAKPNEQKQEEKEQAKKESDFVAEFTEFKQLFEQELNAIKEQVTKQKELFNSQVEQKLNDIEQDKTIDKFLSEKQFVNDFTRQAIKSQVKTALTQEEHKDKDLNTLYNELTTGLNNIYANPNPVVIQQGNHISSDALDIYENQKKIYKALGVTLN